MASLAYAEVADVSAAASGLQAAGMAELLAADDWPDILQARRLPGVLTWEAACSMHSTRCDSNMAHLPQLGVQDWGSD